MTADQHARRVLYDQGLNDVEIAAAERVTRWAVLQWRRKHGLPSRIRGYAPLSEAQRAKRMLLYQLGWSDTRMAKEAGVEQSTITRWRDQMGLAPNVRQSQREKRAISIEAILPRIRRAVGRALSPDIADDAVGNLMLAVMDGSLPIAEIEKAARRFGNRVLDQFASRFGPRSLDEELGDDGDGFRMIDLIRDERSSSWLEDMGATVW